MTISSCAPRKAGRPKTVFRTDRAVAVMFRLKLNVESRIEMITRGSNRSLLHRPKGIAKVPISVLPTAWETAAAGDPAAAPPAAVRPGSPRQCPPPAGSAAARGRLANGGIFAVLQHFLPTERPGDGLDHGVVHVSVHGGYRDVGAVRGK